MLIGAITRSNILKSIEIYVKFQLYPYLLLGINICCNVWNLLQIYMHSVEYQILNQLVEIT